MPQIPETCEFDVTTDQIQMTTKTNGDRISITGIHLGRDSAAILAWLVNSGPDLTIEVKLKT